MQSESDGSTSIDQGVPKFGFGKNWNRFLATVGEDRVARAQCSVQSLLGVEHLQGQRVLDAGSGSGLFSLAAYRLGASVVSFDADADSVRCTQDLRLRFAADDPRWSVRSGSLLDTRFLDSLGQFDVVYCWGVLHHTGDMWRALSNLLPCVSENGRLAIAIYNDELYLSRLWRGVKLVYQKLPWFLRPVYVFGIGSLQFARRLAFTLAAMALRTITLRDPCAPIRNWIGERNERGMHAWYDLVDWIGGWPYEVAKPEEVFYYLRERGYNLEELKTSSGHGCNEFVFQRGSEDSL